MQEPCRSRRGVFLKSRFRNVLCACRPRSPGLLRLPRQGHCRTKKAVSPSLKKLSETSSITLCFLREGGLRRPFLRNGAPLPGERPPFRGTENFLPRRGGKEEGTFRARKSGPENRMLRLPSTRGTAVPGNRTSPAVSPSAKSPRAAFPGASPLFRVRQFRPVPAHSRSTAAERPGAGIRAPGNIQKGGRLPRRPQSALRLLTGKRLFFSEVPRIRGKFPGRPLPSARIGEKPSRSGGDGNAPFPCGLHKKAVTIRRVPPVFSPGEPLSP